MEAVLKNLRSTVELLAVAALSGVGVVDKWDKQTLCRAFQWARYCEHVFSRFQDNPAVRNVMEEQLQLTNQSLRAALPGHTEVSFSDLSRCQHLLLVGLLNNPELPSSIIKILFDTPSPLNTSDEGVEDVTGLCSRIIHCKSACKVLGPLTDGADAEVQGAMLRERLGALLGQGSDPCRTEHFLESVLQGCAGAEEHFCLLVAAALLIPKNSEIAAHDFLLDWLQKRHSMLQHMCSALSDTILMDLAREHLKFRDAYYGLLKKWASDMEYSINDRTWVHSSTNPTVSFQKLTEHFLLLFKACPSVKEDVEKELNELKISDGDFDVRGLSVWGDLLSVLNQ